MEEKIYNGILKLENGNAFILGRDDERYFEGEPFWNGYLKHFAGKKVFARRLAQRDYTTGKPIIIMWPDDNFLDSPCVDLYYNERLVKYPASRFGHIAINTDGEIFNFSHLINENEILKLEEYFYRPALGEFAPHPETQLYNCENPEKPYFDKFGRLFMRNIHVLRIRGLDVKILSGIFRDELKRILETPPDPEKPGKYRDFNFATKNCAVIIRKGLTKYGLRGLGGSFPRDFFTNASYYFTRRAKKLNLKVKIFKLDQLKVDEAPYSRLTPLINPLNRVKRLMLTYTNR